MAGIGGQRNGDFAPGIGVADAARAHVVLHVARPLCAGRIDVAFELGKDLPQRLADDVGQHVQPAAVRHADDHFMDVVVRRAIDDGVDDRDGRLRAFQRESLLPDVARVQEVLELFGIEQVAKNAELGLAV